MSTREMQLLSTSKKTVLSDFADLETKSTYNHANGESTDFQFNAQRRIFVEVNRKSGLEVMRIKQKKDQSHEVQRLRKLTIENVYSVGCAKQTVEEIALGLGNGQIKLYNYKTAALLHRYQADNKRSTVLFLDYNCTDEYIASVLDSGSVNIYGNNTKTRIETINIDDNSTVARFHPKKRLQLSIASYKGTVTVYDVQAKRKIFNHTEAHSAPCRDVCMSSANPETLVSVGFDCKINIFDIRRKAVIPQGNLKYNHPLSTVALSDCGTYFCVGNLKGDLMTFDMRNTKDYLANRKVHDCAVMRVSFVPPLEEVSEIGSTSSATAGKLKPGTHQNEYKPSTTDLSKSIAVKTHSFQSQMSLEISQVDNCSMATSTAATTAAVQGPRDSFCDFLDSQANKVRDRMSTRFTSRRDSYDWDSLARKDSNEEIRQSLYQINSCPSSLESTNISAAESFDAKITSTERSAQLQQTLSGPLQDRSNTSNLSTHHRAKLMQIDEEEPLTGQPQKDEPPRHQLTSANDYSSSDKENPQVELELPGRFRLLEANRNSTPNPGHHILQSRKSVEGLLGTVKTTSSGLAKSSSMLSAIEANADIRREFSELRTHIDKRLSYLETELKYIAEDNTWKIFTHAMNLWNQEISTLQEIRGSVAVLLRNDEYVQEFVRLQQENRELRAQLQQKQEPQQ